MADIRGSGTVACSDRCGCPVPCPGGTACRCRIISPPETGGDGHNTCSCGEHCGCNPCSCPKGSETTEAGKGNCNCGAGCTCATCAS